MTTINTIYGLRKELGLDDDTARDLYQREVGKRSLREMSPPEQLRVAQALQGVARSLQRGVEKTSQGPRARLDGPYAKKLQALWISGYQLGLINDRTDAALLAFVEGRTGIAHTRFLRDPKDARKAVEALKSWLERGGVDWTQSDDPEAAVLMALGRRLGIDRLDPGEASVSGGRQSALAQGWWHWRQEGLSAAERHDLAQRLGAELRKRGDRGSARR